MRDCWFVRLRWRWLTTHRHPTESITCLSPRRSPSCRSWHSTDARRTLEKAKQGCALGRTGGAPGTRRYIEPPGSVADKTIRGVKLRRSGRGAFHEHWTGDSCNATPGRWRRSRRHRRCRCHRRCRRHRGRARRTLQRLCAYGREVPLRLLQLTHLRCRGERDRSRRSRSQHADPGEVCCRGAAERALHKCGPVAGGGAVDDGHAGLPRERSRDGRHGRETRDVAPRLPPRETVRVTGEGTLLMWHCPTCVAFTSPHACTLPRELQTAVDMVRETTLFEYCGGRR